MGHDLSDAPAAAESPLHAAARRFLSGAASGTLTAALLQPLDVIKTTQQGRVLEALALRDAARAAAAAAAAAATASSGGTAAPSSAAAAAALRVGPPLPQAMPRGGGSTGLGATAASLLREEGVAGLWKGLNATVIRVFFGAGIYFVALTAIADALGAKSVVGVSGAGGGAGVSSTSGGGGGGGGDARQFLAGMLARSFATTIMTPVAVVKTRREWASLRAAAAPGGAPRGTLAAIAHIARSEGAASLYSGILPTLARDAPFSGLYFAFFTRLRDALEPPPASSALGAGGGSGTLAWLLAGAPASARTFAAGLAAGAFATLLTHPADVLKTRLQIRSAKGRFVDGRVLLDELSALLRAEGPRGLLVGAGARIAKRALSSAFTWTLYDEAMRRSAAGTGGGGSGGGAAGGGGGSA
jgi:solute carrier family 25 protein 38